MSDEQLLPTSDNVNQPGLVYSLLDATVQLNGSVVNGSTPVGGLRLLATDQNGTTFSLRSQPNGTFSLPAVAGNWLLSADAREAAARRLSGTPLAVTVGSTTKTACPSP